MLILIITLTTLLCIIIAAVVYFRLAEEKYVDSVVTLPAKIDYVKPEQRKSGLGGVLMNIVSIGGHARLRDAVHRYEDTYDLYALEFNDFVDHYAALIDSLNALGRKTKQSMTVLRGCQQMLAMPIHFEISSPSAHQFDDTLYQITRYTSGVTNSESSGVVLMQGSTIGGLAAVGSWSLVTMLGSASTGAAISGLYGAAATNATLAWFGGGALAAGGGGVAAGAMTLGAIVAAPLVAFTVYKTHSKASEVEQQISDINYERELTRDNDERITTSLTLCTAQLQQLTQAYDRLSYVEASVRKQLYPHGIWSQIARKLGRLVGKSHISAAEVQILARLNQEVESFCAAFSPAPASTNPPAAQPLAPAQMTYEAPSALTTVSLDKALPLTTAETVVVEETVENPAVVEVEAAPVERAIDPVIAAEENQSDESEHPPSAPAPVDLTKHAAAVPPQPPVPPASAAD